MSGVTTSLGPNCLDLCRMEPFVSTRDQIRTVKSALAKSNRKTLRVLLVGKTGVGKSRLGNHLLSSGSPASVKAFRVAPSGSAESCTRDVLAAYANLDCGDNEGLVIEVFDTPGLYDSRHSSDQEKQQAMKRLLQWLKDIFDGGGIDVIILVDKYFSFDSIDQDMIKALNNLFDGGGDGSAENLWKHGVIAFTNAWVVDRQPLEELRPWDVRFQERLTKVQSVFDAMKMPRPRGVAVELLPMVQEKNSRGETLLPDRKTEQDALLWHAIARVVAHSSATVQIKAPIMEQVLCALG